MKGFTAKKAAIVTLLLLVVLVAYHLLILLGIIPDDYVWGGRLKTKNELMVMVAISLVTSLIMAVVVFLRLQQIHNNKGRLFVSILIWLMGVYFALNTAGNLLSEEFWEKVFMTPFSLLLAILCVRMALWRPTVAENQNAGNPELNADRQD